MQIQERAVEDQTTDAGVCFRVAPAQPVQPQRHDQTAGGVAVHQNFDGDPDGLARR